MYAFEPVPKIYQRLEKNRGLNDAQNLVLIQSAVSNFEGKTTLYIPSGRMPTSSSTAKGHRRAVETIEVSTITLDNFVESEQLSKVDLIKLDTESTEPLVLEGGIELIKRDQPIIVCEVLRDNTGKAIQTILDSYGYHYFWITAKGLIRRQQVLGDPKFKFLNHLFVPPSRILDIENFWDIQ